MLQSGSRYRKLDAKRLEVGAPIESSGTAQTMDQGTSAARTIAVSSMYSASCL